jgi:transcriptional regulator with XRE-family HTH domain
MPRLFSAKLRYLRQQHNLTQTELARALSLATHTHISQMESQIRTPSLDLILTIADYFGVTTDYLLCDQMPVDEPVVVAPQPRTEDSANHRLFGSKLRALRVRHGMTQVALGKELALTAHTHISRMEAGRKEPSIDLVLRIANFFGVTTDYLLRDTIPVEYPSSDTTPGIQ